MGPRRRRRAGPRRVGDLAAPPRRQAARAAWDRLQITSTGEADAPLVSPDGKQIVYASRTCAEDGTCNAQLVLFDLPTGARQILADSLEAVQPLAWSSDGAWLLVAASTRGIRGITGGYVLSHLGGPMTALGGAATFTPHGDTALAASPGVYGRDTVHLRRFVPPWSQPIDSIAVAPPAKPYMVAVAGMSIAPSGKWLAVEWYLATGECVLQVYDRAGRAADSLSTPLASSGNSEDLAPSLAWSASGTKLLVGVNTANGEAGLRRIAVDPSTGRLGTEDTLLLATSRDLPRFGRSADGTMLAYTVTQRGQRVLWTLEASRPGLFPRPVRRARTASTAFNGDISPDGATVVYTVKNASESGTTFQVFAEPFDGGVAHAVTPPLRSSPRGVITSDSRSAIVATPSSSGHTRLTAYDLASGRSHMLIDLPDSGFAFARAGPDGVAIVPSSGDSIIVLDGHGKMLRRIAVPDSLGTIPFAVPSPDGRDFAALIIPKDLAAAVGSDENLHTPIDRVSSAGVFSPVTVARFEHLRDMHWIRGGTLWWIGDEASDRQLAVYRVPVAGGEQKRGELLPFPQGFQWCDLSADGTRGVAMVAKPLTDVWVIRNFNGGGP